MDVVEAHDRLSHLAREQSRTTSRTNEHFYKVYIALAVALCCLPLSPIACLALMAEVGRQGWLSYQHHHYANSLLDDLLLLNDEINEYAQ